MKLARVWIGIDPGFQSGAIAAYGPLCEPQFIRLNETPGDINEWLKRLLRDYSVIAAVIEKVNAMPKQGVSSSFKFGASAGFVHGLVLAHEIPRAFVRPQEWQKQLGCLTKGNKNVTKEKAQSIWPSMKVTHSNADALLLAMYASRMSLHLFGRDS